MTLFVSAFPLAPFLSLFSNIVEIRTDGWKLLHAFRRAQPLGAEDIGTWFAIFQVGAAAAAPPSLYLLPVVPPCLSVCLSPLLAYSKMIFSTYYS